MQTKIRLLFCKNAKYTNWGLKSCSKSMYSGGFEYYIYGIKRIFNITRLKQWGDFIN